MKKLLVLILAISVTSCAAFKVVPEGKLVPVTKNQGEVTVTKNNGSPGGVHCFEPMLYVLSLGIIPTHCVDTYSISTESQQLGKVKVTSMNGWAALFIAPFPVWQYGSGESVESEIKDLVRYIE